ncbi:MAG: ATP-binding protein [Candidatus Latescibacterota bacterium]
MDNTPGKITLAAEMESLFPLLEYTRDRLRERGFAADAAARLELAMEEILVNIIHYAYPESSGDIELNFSGDEDGTVIEIRDRGVPFNPLDLPEPDLHASVEERPIGGLGIYFARNIADGMEYLREDGCNILRLTMRG